MGSRPSAGNVDAMPGNVNCGAGGAKRTISVALVTGIRVSFFFPDLPLGFFDGLKFGISFIIVIPRGKLRDLENKCPIRQSFVNPEVFRSVQIIKVTLAKSFSIG